MRRRTVISFGPLPSGADTLVALFCLCLCLLTNSLPAAEMLALALLQLRSTAGCRLGLAPLLFNGRRRRVLTSDRLALFLDFDGRTEREREEGVNSIAIVFTHRVASLGGAGAGRSEDGNFFSPFPSQFWSRAVWRVGNLSSGTPMERDS